jgi:phosphoribosylaminoimidazole-succinocarboxamide synthase
MLKIGDFARLSNVPVKTLRYYDDLGLFTPAQVDDFTGYRYYTTDQLPRLNRLLALKDLGFALDQIARVLNEGVTHGQLRGMLMLKRAEVEDRLSEERRRLDRIEARLKEIEQEDTLLESTATPVMIDCPLPNRTYRGKVRDTYDLGDRLLIVATDRISAYDAVLSTGIPDKGKVLSQMSAWWFERTKAVVPNHFIRLADGTPADHLPFALPPELAGRSTIAKKAQRVDVECIVRGYISGSAWAEYSEHGTVNGVRMQKGLLESQQLPEPMFTPTTKAEEGHDQPMTFSDLIEEVGPEPAKALQLRSIALYNFSAAYARERGIIIADTKFEFGYIDGELHVIDEILTPDSSRFWDAADYKAGGPQPSFDKQYVRDWLSQSGWNRQPPAPPLPGDVVAGTRARYAEAYRRLTGLEVR